MCKSIVIDNMSCLVNCSACMSQLRVGRSQLRVYSNITVSHSAAADARGSRHLASTLLQYAHSTYSDVHVAAVSAGRCHIYISRRVHISIDIIGHNNSRHERDGHTTGVNIQWQQHQRNRADAPDCIDDIDIRRQQHYVHAASTV